MHISTTVIGTAAGLLAAAAIAVGAGTQDGGTATVPGDDAARCVLAAADRPWEAGDAARGEALNAANGIAATAPDGPVCADVPDWFRALVLRGDALNRLHGLGRTTGVAR